MDTASLLQDIVTRGFDPLPHEPSVSDKPIRWGKNQRYWLFYFGARAHYGDYAENTKYNWFQNGSTEFTPEEKERIAEARRQRKREQADQHEAIAEKAKKMWDTASEHGSSQYITSKGITGLGIKYYKNSIIIPARDIIGKIWTLQFITDTPLADGRTKIFLTDGKKEGNFFLLGELKPPYIICEGYATGCSIYEATGINTLVAFDAGNLQPVIRNLQVGGEQITIAADNDQWGERNTGVTAAEECSQIFGCAVITPQFANTDTKPTDFNDLHQLEGLDAVRRQIIGEPEPEILLPTSQAPFKYLGYDKQFFYFLVRESNQIKPVAPNALTKDNLLLLAPLHWWEQIGGGKLNGGVLDNIKDNIIRRQYANRFYVEDKAIGAGATWDEDRAVYHFGDRLLVDNKPTPLFDIESSYIYEETAKLKFEMCEPATDEEAEKLIDICDMLSWEKPVDSRLMAGWIVCAIVAGALKWRPHIWLTSSVGGGKTWVQNHIIRPILRPMLVADDLQGATTSAAISGMLGTSSLALVIDESEATGQQKQQSIIQDVLFLIRQSSSGGTIAKGTQTGGVIKKNIRSCFCLGSVAVATNESADVSRITALTLVADNTDAGQKHFSNTIEPSVLNTITPEFCNKIRARAILNMATIRRNADVFCRAAATDMRSKRFGDQAGTLMAGMYLLQSTNIIKLEDAKAIIGQYQWEEQKETASIKEEMRLLEYIMEQSIEVYLDKGMRRFAIRECVAKSASDYGENHYFDALIRIGMKTDSNNLYISNTHSALTKMLAATPWKNHGRLLRRLEGIKPSDKAIYFKHNTARASVVPLSMVIESEPG